jgi:four helix bundle protein
VGVRRLEQLDAWCLAESFKVEVYRLVRSSPEVLADLHFRDQLRSSAASVSMNIAEGFYRYRVREFARFLSIALASLGEATLWLRDGIQRGHYPASACECAFGLARRCRLTTLRLHKSLRELATNGTNERQRRRMDERQRREDDRAIVPQDGRATAPQDGRAIAPGGRTSDSAVRTDQR